MAMYNYYPQYSMGYQTYYQYPMNYNMYSNYYVDPSYLDGRRQRIRNKRRPPVSVPRGRTGAMGAGRSPSAFVPMLARGAGAVIPMLANRNRRNGGGFGQFAGQAGLMGLNFGLRELGGMGGQGFGMGGLFGNGDGPVGMVPTVVGGGGGGGVGDILGGGGGVGDILGGGGGFGDIIGGGGGGLGDILGGGGGLGDIMGGFGDILGGF